MTHRAMTFTFTVHLAHPPPRPSPPRSEAAEVGHLVRHCGASANASWGAGQTACRARPAPRGQVECLPLAVPGRRLLALAGSRRPGQGPPPGAPQRRSAPRGRGWLAPALPPGGARPWVVRTLSSSTGCKPGRRSTRSCTGTHRSSSSTGTRGRPSCSSSSTGTRRRTSSSTGWRMPSCSTGTRCRRTRSTESRTRSIWSKGAKLSEQAGRLFPHHSIIA